MEGSSSILVTASWKPQPAQRGTGSGRLGIWGFRASVGEGSLGRVIRDDVVEGSEG